MIGCDSEPDPDTEPPPLADLGSGTTGDMGVTDDGVADDGMPDQSVGCDPCDYVPADTYAEFTELSGITVPSRPEGRELPVLVRFPTGATGPLPVVIWSHGGSWGSSKEEQHKAWSEALVRSGYAVVHYSMVRPTPEQLQEMCMFVGLMDPTKCEDLSITGGVDEETEPEDSPFSATAIARPEDVKAVLASLTDLRARLMDMGVELDIDAPALAGWSAGSQSTLQLAGAKRLVVEGVDPYSSPEASVSAFLALSPQGPGFSGYFEGADGHSWEDVRGPVMVITGVGDTKSANTLTGPIRRRVYELMPAGDKRLFYSTDAGEGIKHNSFNLDGLGNRDARIDGLARAVRSSGVAFLDCHARGRQEACAWLETDAALQLASGMAEVETK